MFKMGSGAAKTAALDATGLQLREVHYDITVRHLHAATLRKLMAAMREASTNARTDPAEVQAALLGPLGEHGLALLAHDPGLLVDRLGIVTPEGEAVLKGSARLVGMSEADLSAGFAALLPRLSADHAFEAPQALLEEIPNGATVVGAGIDGGYLKREGGKLISHVEFHDGTLKVNGKSPQLPAGLGTQPAPLPRPPVARPHAGA